MRHGCVLMFLYTGFFLEKGRGVGVVIHRILNNNVAITLDNQGGEQIVCGKGIAFKKRIGDSIDESSVNQVFVLKDEMVNEQLLQLLKEIPMEVMELTTEIVEMANLVLGKQLKESLVISLSDHITCAVNNYHNGITLKNVLVWDIKRFYEREFSIGERAVAMIKEKLAIDLPIDEAGFIALHIVNSESTEEDMDQTVQITQMIQEIANIVKYHFSIEYNTESVHYYRFITHLKFFAQRIIVKKEASKEVDPSLYEMVKANYNDAYQGTLKIGKFLQEKYNYTLTDDDRLYLMIHINRILTT